MDNLWRRQHLGLSSLTGRASLMNGRLKQAVAGMQLNIRVQDGAVTSETSQALTLIFTKYSHRVNVKKCSVSKVLRSSFYFLSYHWQLVHEFVVETAVMLKYDFIFFLSGEGGRGLGRTKRRRRCSPSSYSQMPVRCSQQTPLLSAWDGLVYRRQKFDVQNLSPRRTENILPV